MLLNITFILCAYLIGSLSSAIIVCKLWRLPDPRSQGSKNPGATNVLRIGGKLPAIVTLLGDGCKGLLPTLLAVQMHLPAWVIGCVMLAALLGHIFPLFFQFEGGKGVATSMGAYLGLFWPLGAVLIAVWGGIIVLTRLSSLGAIVATILAPLIGWWFLHQVLYTIIFVIMTAILLWRHKDNIRRLLTGKETKI